MEDLTRRNFTLEVDFVCTKLVKPFDFVIRVIEEWWKIP